MISNSLSDFLVKDGGAVSTLATVQKKDMCNFLGVMSYRGKNLDPVVKNGAIKTMDIYNKLPDGKKREFVAQFFAEGGSKNKNNDWVSNYKEEVTTENSSSATEQEALLNRIINIYCQSAFFRSL
jgi:hypothetical protein